jgi:hypothetical protein
MTPQQDSLSGVIICPGFEEGQRLRVNSFTTTNSVYYTPEGNECQSFLGAGFLLNWNRREGA